MKLYNWMHIKPFCKTIWFFRPMDSRPTSDSSQRFQKAQHQSMATRSFLPRIRARQTWHRQYQNRQNHPQRPPQNFLGRIWKSEHQNGWWKWFTNAIKIEGLASKSGYTWVFTNQICRFNGMYTITRVYQKRRSVQFGEFYAGLFRQTGFRTENVHCVW